MTDFRRQLSSRRPSDWEHLPDFPLYMDQVLSYMERQTVRLDEDDALFFASYTAAITVSRMGAMPSLPTLEEVLQLIRQRGETSIPVQLLDILKR